MKTLKKIVAYFFLWVIMAILILGTLGLMGWAFILLTYNNVTGFLIYMGISVGIFLLTLIYYAIMRSLKFKYKDTIVSKKQKLFS